MSPALPPRTAGIAVLLVILAAGFARARAGPGSVLPPQSRAAWRVAITIDDLPMTGGSCTAEAIDSLHDALLAALARHAIVATGFVIPGTSCQGPGPASASAVATRWIRAGHEIGNHAFTHPDLNTVPAAGYLADVARADRALAPVLEAAGQEERWFRPPQLHAGPDPGRKAALERWMVEHGYRMGVVTIDNQEWVFAAAYQRARTRSDSSAMTRVVDGYIDHLLECARYYRALSRQLFQREIPQVLLLHANRLNADHLERVLAALRLTGASFIPLRAAVTDSAYALPDPYVGPRGLSWLQRWALDRGVTPGPEPREPAWVRRIGADSESVFR